jgi:hypothetical protein
LLPTLLGAAAPALGAAATGAGLTTLGGLLGSKFGAMGLGALAGGLMNKQNPLMGAITGGLGGMGGAGLAKGFGLGGAGAATGQGLQGAALGGTGQAGLGGLGVGAGEGLNLASAGAGAPGLTASASNIGTQMAAKGAPMAFTGSAAPMTTAEMLRSGAMAAAPAMDAMMSQRPVEMPEEETGSIPEYDFAYNPTGYTTRGSEELLQFRPTYTRRMAEGGDVGIAALARGGMKAGGFVVPADVVSMIGEGNTEAGYEQIKRMLPGATPIKGKDGGQADTVKTSIEGKQPARVAHGEVYVPPETVKRAGGAKKLYAMMKNVRKMAKGDDKQIEPVDLREAMA